MKSLVVFFTLISKLAIGQSYSSELLQIKPLAKQIWLHESIHSHPEWGSFGSNGLIYKTELGAWLLDTPISDSLTLIILDFIRDSLQCEVIGFIPNHFHDDCIGGIEHIQSIAIPIVCHQITAQHLSSTTKSEVYTFSKDSVVVADKLYLFYPGPGHSKDNIVCWFPEQNLLFGGCMVKSAMSRSAGNILDADLDSWPTAVKMLQQRFPTAKIVVPGHGEIGDISLLSHTLTILQQ